MTRVLGLRRKTVRLVPYLAKWAELFEAERRCLDAAFGDTIIAIEHVGSTAVPGIMAKPILDMNVGVRTLDVAQGMKNIFETLGYEHRAFKEGHTVEALRDQELFVKGRDSRRTHHVHVAVHGSITGTSTCCSAIVYGHIPITRRRIRI